MKKRCTLLILLFPLWLFSQNCAECTIQLAEDLAADTIFMDAVPSATVGEYYEQSISFRLPKTTDAVAVLDPSIPAGIAIDAIAISNISGIPAGLTWAANQDNYVLADGTDGCIMICGTPFNSGDFDMDVTLTAQISILTQAANIVLPMTVLPATSVSEGFTLTNNAACGTLEASFQNNVPSNGSEGFTYNWDFGNGLNSTLENPPVQVYTEPGTYYIQYDATIDTVGYLLTQIKVETASCDDIAIPLITDGSPELYVRVLDANGNWLHESGFVTDMAPPLTFDLNIELLPNESYTLQIWDEDAGIDGMDDLCGEININNESSGLLSNGDVSAQLTILHPTTSVSSMDSVVVYALPDAPIVAPVELSNLCVGERVVLMIENYETGLQWYQDETIVGAANELEVTETGTYWAAYLDENGCEVLSTPWEVVFTPLPNEPAYTNTNNVLSLFENVALPEFHALQWYYEGALLDGETTPTICAEETGQYTLTVTDLVTGCSNTFHSNIIINDNFDCTVGLEIITALDLAVFPNPFSNQLQIQAEESIEQVRVWNVNGQVILEQKGIHSSNSTLETNVLETGFYVVEVQTARGVQFVKVVKD